SGVGVPASNKDDAVGTLQFSHPPVDRHPQDKQRFHPSFRQRGFRQIRLLILQYPVLDATSENGCSDKQRELFPLPREQQGLPPHPVLNRVPSTIALR